MAELEAFLKKKNSFIFCILFKDDDFENLLE